MISRDGIKVAMTTTGSVTPGFEERRKNYVYGGDKHDEPGTRRDRLGSGPGSGERRRKRIDDFEAALRDKGYDPAANVIPAAVLREAGSRVGVGVDTARDYRAELRKRTSCGGEVRDA